MLRKGFTLHKREEQIPFGERDSLPREAPALEAGGRRRRVRKDGAAGSGAGGHPGAHRIAGHQAVRDDVAVAIADGEIACLVAGAERCAVGK